MRCRTCDYPLWNIPVRTCPECGSPFRPGDFEFVPNAVRFGCPHCGQTYYGTSPQGHLVPRSFQCAGCGRAIDMDETVLSPAEGLTEHQTQPRTGAPWLERDRRGWWRSWLATVGRALVAPRDLMRAVPPGRLAQAWWFVTVTMLLTTAASLVVALPLMGVMLALMLPALPPGAPGAGVGAIVGMMSALATLGIGFGIVATLIWIALWGPITHGLLRLTGPTAGTIGRTYQALCYSAGAYVTTAVPCFGQYMGMVWWIVSAVMAVKEVQRTSGLRATFAVVSGPLAMLILFVGGYAALIGVAIASATTNAPQAVGVARTQSVLEAVLAHGQANAGAGPDHALRLVTDEGPLMITDLIGRDTLTDTADVPAGDGTLDDFAMLPADDQAAVAQEAALALPGRVVAHRVGDFVFTYHGIDLSKPQPGLWVVVLSPDPAENPRRPQSLVVGMSDGSVTTISAGALPMMLEMQNAARAQAGLPALPDPATVTHERPAVAGP